MELRGKGREIRRAFQDITTVSLIMGTVAACEGYSWKNIDAIGSETCSTIGKGEAMTISSKHISSDEVVESTKSISELANNMFYVEPWGVDGSIESMLSGISIEIKNDNADSIDISQDSFLIPLSANPD